MDGSVLRSVARIAKGGGVLKEALKEVLKEVLKEAKWSRWLISWCA